MASVVTAGTRIVSALRRSVRWGSRLGEWEERRFERRLGVDTAGSADVASLTIRAGDPTAGIPYGPAPLRLVRWVLRELQQDVRKRTFIDLGSGKGRVVLAAAAHGFRKSIGVEYAEELHLAALENARAARARGLVIESILGDAGSFRFPAEPLVVYFNNPFREPVMESVIANLTASYRFSPRPIALVYQQLRAEPPETRTRNLELLESVPFVTGRTLAPRRPIDRRLLADWLVRVFETRHIGPQPYRA
jgi:SAM-dependent methyltransferase